MRISQLKNNLTKIDAFPNGIFFMSYQAPIAFIQGREELVTMEKYSSSTSRHVTFLKGKYIRPSADLVTEERLIELAKKAGIEGNW